MLTFCLNRYMHNLTCLSIVLLLSRLPENESLSQQRTAKLQCILHSISFTFHSFARARRRSSSFLLCPALHLAQAWSIHPSICSVRWIKWRLTNVKTANMCSRSPAALCGGKGYFIYCISPDAWLALALTRCRSRSGRSCRWCTPSLSVSLSLTFYHNHVDMGGPCRPCSLWYWPFGRRCACLELTWWLTQRQHTYKHILLYYI